MKYSWTGLTSGRTESPFSLTDNKDNFKRFTNITVLSTADV